MKISKIIKHCLNPFVLVGIGVVIFIAYKFMPSLANYSWVLITLICPLSMIFMMKGMNHGNNEVRKVFVCAECGLSYDNPDLAQKCSKWCKENNSRNVEITKYSINKNENNCH